MTSQTYPQPQGSRLLPVTDRLSRLPYWLLAAILLAIYFLWVIATNGDYQVIFSATVKGMGTTIYVTLIAYTVATLLGLVMGLLRLSKRRVIQEASQQYHRIVPPCIAHQARERSRVGQVKLSGQRTSGEEVTE